MISAVSSSEYSKLRRKVGTKTQVARLLAVAPRTVQRRENDIIPVTKETWLALKHLAESSDYAGERRPVDTWEKDVSIEGERRKNEEMSAAGVKGWETRRRRRANHRV